MRHASVLQLEDAARLRAGGNPQWRRTVDCGNRQLVAQRRLGDVDRQVEDDIVLVALEDLVRLHLHQHVEIAGRAALRARLTLAGETQLLAVVHARGHAHLQLARLALAARAAALLAGVGDHAPLAVAAVAGGDVDELAEDALLHAAHLAAAVAAGAAFGLAARFGADAAAEGALLGAADLDLLLRAEDRLFEGQGQVVAQVGAALRAAPLAGGAAEEGVEDVAEAAEIAEALEAAARLLAHAGPAEAVVGGALLRIGEDLERLVDLFEALLRPVILIAVGMVLHRQLAEGLLDLFRAGRARHAEHVVVVLLLCGHLRPVCPAAARCESCAKNGPREAAASILPGPP